jgi:hypothetical protein
MISSYLTFGATITLPGETEVGSAGNAADTTERGLCPAKSTEFLDHNGLEGNTSSSAMSDLPPENAASNRSSRKIRSMRRNSRLMSTRRDLLFLGASPGHC